MICFVATSRTDVNHNRFLVRLRIGLILLIALVLPGCDSPRDESLPPDVTPLVKASPPKRDNYVIANPNPVPAGPRPLGRTLISWSTKDIPPEQVQIYVSEEGGDETLFASGLEGSQEAPWITSESPIEFKLYRSEGSNRKLLDKVVVSRQR